MDWFDKVKFLDIYKEPLKIQGGSTLISVGTTNSVSKQELQVLADKIARTSSLNRKIFLDPRIFKHLPNNADKNIVVADYSDEMYSKVQTAFIRPGLSTLQRLLAHNIESNALLVGINEEILSTATTIEKNAWGKIYSLTDLDTFECNTKRYNRNVRDFFYTKTELKLLVERIFISVFL